MNNPDLPNQDQSHEIFMRGLRPADAGALTEIARRTYFDTFVDHYGEALCERNIVATRSPSTMMKYITDGITIGAFEEDNLIGYVQFSGDVPFILPGDHEARRDDPGVAALNHLYLLDAHHGRGIGTKLLRSALAAARPRFDDIYLQVWDQNDGAIRLYEREGFGCVGTCDGVESYDALTYRLPLTDDAESEGA